MDEAFMELLELLELLEVLEVKEEVITARTPVKGVKYACGCVAGSDRLVLYMFFPQTCITHFNKPIVAFWRE